MLSPSTLARLAPPLFVFLWATGFIAARLVIPYADPLTFLVLRYVLAAILLGLIALAARAPWPTAARGWRNGMIAGMLIHGGYLGAVFWSIKHGLPAGISALIAGLQPLVTGMLVGPLIGERVSARRWLGIAVGFLGTALVIAPKLGAAGGFSALRSRFASSARSRSRLARSGRSAPPRRSICAPTRWRNSSARRSPPCRWR
ncbi:MAG TPA: DMT family transporter [Beijerinckiaceae bacterium]|nr:DMT family transporter [Beijerinckiaceae bacterium]